MAECIVEILSDLESFTVANYIGLLIQVSPGIGNGLVLRDTSIGPRGRMNTAHKPHSESQNFSPVMMMTQSNAKLLVQISKFVFGHDASSGYSKSGELYLSRTRYATYFELSRSSTHVIALTQTCSVAKPKDYIIGMTKLVFKVRLLT